MLDNRNDVVVGAKTGLPGQAAAVCDPPSEKIAQAKMVGPDTLKRELQPVGTAAHSFGMSKHQALWKCFL